jgi:folate-binding protein YgfZ
MTEFNAALAPAPLPASDNRRFVVALRPGFGVLSFKGPDAATFLQGQLSNDVTALTTESLQWSSYNSPKGRMLATLCLWRAGPEEFRALLAGDLAEPVRKRLAQFVLRAKVAVADLTPSLALFGIGGEGARAAVAAALGAAPQPGNVVQSAGATALGLPDGRIVVCAPIESSAAFSRDLAGADGTATDGAGWTLLAIRAGVPHVTAATQGLFVPQTANWELVGGVHFKKGCYPGQEIVARMQYLGRLKERLVRFGAPAGTPAPSPGTPIFGSAFPDAPCGTVVNAAALPGEAAELLAVVQLAALDQPPLRLGAADGPALTPLSLPYALPAVVAATRPKL